MFGKIDLGPLLKLTGWEKVQNRMEIIMGVVCPIVLILELNVGRRGKGTLLSVAHAAACVELKIGLLQWYQ